MSQFYTQEDLLHVAVDCAVFGYDTSDGQLKVLLFKRKVKPLSNRWSLVGSFVQKNEDLRDAAIRVLHDFTGLEDVFLKQLRCYGKVKRDPGGRVISILYWSLIKLEEQKQHVVNSHGAKWYNIDDVPKLVLDHNDMIREVLLKIRRIAMTAPIGKELLPEFFTIPQLLQLYQAIYQRELDDRNFRKKILSTSLLIKQNHKDKSSSKKGAFYYKFDHNKYSELLDKGYHIDF
ncbi:NUDIX domain-containing protein [Fulvivirgaceae bacterium BMA10]|uniref:NUDIX domain-containing protein n=1 Tax=Splendidivirga corallicola TaxID=3051826 RepID=A0ABT8KL61_9BACT|nr:NUDIX domain-containing protein [Fulvivirgaceae bacterium BMA10]